MLSTSVFLKLYNLVYLLGWDLLSNWNVGISFLSKAAANLVQVVDFLLLHGTLDIQVPYAVSNIFASLSIIYHGLTSCFMLYEILLLFPLYH
jgi:hypothetical protein